MRQPLVSIVVATYRRDDSLKDALYSLSCQTYQNTEIILVSDNADNEWNNKVTDIAKGFIQINPSIPLKFIVNQVNKGSAETRNIGIRAAGGEYITFLDDDDLYLPEKIEKQINKMHAEAADYGITDLFLYDEKDRLIDRRIRNYIRQTDANSLLTYHLKFHITGTDAMMFRREYLEHIGGFPLINIGDEFYLMERAIQGGGKFCYCSGCEVKAYVHSETDGLSSGKRKINGENELYAYKKSIWTSLNSVSRRYIRMRHYAVIAFAELRRKQYAAFIGAAICAFFCAPMACVSLLLNRR